MSLAVQGIAAADYTQHLMRRMTERELMEHVRQLLNWGGWLWVHHYSSRRSNPGFPDICAVRNGVVLFAELKRESGYLSAPQRAWQDALTQASEASPGNLLYFVWRPSDWISGAILRVLQ